MAETETFAIVAFNGALTRHWQRQEPPHHFHPYLEEYVEVLQGTLIVEVEGRAYRLEPGHPEFVVRRWQNHRLYHQEPDQPHEGGAEDRIVRFLLSGEDTEEVFKLDKIFFQNWYGYQNDLAAGKTKFSLIQVMNVS
ncbi:hypothetical protein GGR55DRAFT_683477 [Xylaria sp. FL0064]|nr:hypothetical protein GGR55DRAFT_683477 [Xylaria sp. FL0064]